MHTYASVIVLIHVIYIVWLDNKICLVIINICYSLNELSLAKFYDSHTNIPTYQSLQIKSYISCENVHSNLLSLSTFSNYGKILSKS